jgi:exodeoxyribonuclease V alpha subunit
VQNIVDDSENGPTAVCDFAGEIKSISGDKLEHLRHAYAITVHSAQGSQFKRVIVIIEKSQLLDRTLIYTALTRGIEQVTFIGDQNAFVSAVASAPSASKRRVWIHF